MIKQLIRWPTVILVVVLATVCAAVPVAAADLRGGETVNIGSGEVVDDDLYIAATEIIINGIVNGDIFGVGTTITINGDVNGSVTLAGQDITLNGEISNSARVAGTNISVNGDIGGDLLLGGTNVHIASTAKIGRDVLFGASTVRINGPVGGYIKGAGSEITFTNGVGGNIELSVDQLIIASTAKLQGNLIYTSANEAEIQSGAQIAGTTYHKIPEERDTAGPFADVWGKVISFLMTLLAGIVIILIAPKRAEAVAASVRQKPWLSLGWGAIILFATPLAALVTFITVVGVPVGLIGLTLYGLAIYLSQIAVGLFIGYWIIGYFRRVESRGILIGALALGFAILTLLKLIPYLGFPLWLATVLFGIGAIVLSEKVMRARFQPAEQDLS